MTRPDDANLTLRIENSLQSQRQRLDGSCGRFLHKDIAGQTMLESIINQIDGIVDAHHKSRHLSISYRQRLSCENLRYK
jgi:hypothetical protein